MRHATGRASSKVITPTPCSLAVSPEKPLRSGAHQPSSPLLSARAALARQYAPPSPYVGNQRSPAARAHEPPLAAGGVAGARRSRRWRGRRPPPRSAPSRPWSCRTTTAHSSLIRTSEILRPRPAATVTALPSRASSTRLSPASPSASRCRPLDVAGAGLDPGVLPVQRRGCGLRLDRVVGRAAARHAGGLVGAARAVRVAGVMAQVVAGVMARVVARAGPVGAGAAGQREQQRQRGRRTSAHVRRRRCAGSGRGWRGTSGRRCATARGRWPARRGRTSTGPTARSSRAAGCRPGSGRSRGRPGSGRSHRRRGRGSTA